MPFLGGGGGKLYKLIGGVSLYHCLTCGGGWYSLYKFVQNVGGGAV